jgi:putative transposase
MQCHRSGYYQWLKVPVSAREKADKRYTGLIKQSWLESGGVYGYRKVHADLREWGHALGVNRVHRLMKAAELKAQRGYNRRPRHKAGKPALAADNHVNREFEVSTPNQVWVTDITYIRTHEGWLYLAVVLDLYSRQVIGWSMQSSLHTDLVLQALLMAVWRRKPIQSVWVHSDQGCQYTSDEWQRFLREHNLKCSMSRRGNCWDNAVVESFFQLLKRERIKRKIYSTREQARRDVFDYIELFYNSTRRHGTNGMLSPRQFEMKNVSV